MSSSPAIHAVRLPLAAWNAACRRVGGDEAPLTDANVTALVASGLAGEDGVVKERWAGLIASYLDAPSSVRASATYGNLLYRASVALGQASICVLERFTTRADDQGGVETIQRDDDLEISVTTGHPWTLLRRVLPPLDNLRASSRQTAPGNAAPVSVPEPILAWAQEQCRTHPADQVLEALQRRSSGRLHDLLQADDASVSYVWTTQTSRGPHLGLAWYLASPDHLFRATFSDDHPFEEVNPGDLAFTFDWHLLGALDALAAPAA